MTIRTRLAAAFCVLAISSAAIADSVRGAWSAPFNWPLIAAHAILTPDGRVLSYGTDGNGVQTGFFIYDVWDPVAGATGTGHLTLPNATATDIFCSSQVILAQSGNIFIAGGDNWVNGATTNTGNNNSNVFNPTGNTLARGNNLNRARWYSTSTTLLNGEVYIQGGNGGGDLPEIRDANGVMRLLTNVNTSGYSATYPRNFLAPDGRIFGFDNTGKMYYVSPGGTGLLTTAGQLPGATSWTASAAMFQPGRIIQMGGASSAALVIDINGAAPVVTSTQSMSTQRQWVSATVLPDGKVLGTGGSAVENQLSGVNNIAEIWNPATGTWTQGASAVNARLYHSGALLLPDASVLIVGGGAPGPLVNLNAEIYYPPYLFEGSVRAARPAIISAPDTVLPGDLFQVGYSGAGSISRVSFIKTGSVTHSNNMDQRYMQLPFTANGALLSVQLPSRAGDLPPGYYMLFVLNAQGVPSVARMVRVGITTTEPPSADFTPAGGGAGGAPFTLACDTNEVLVGVKGSTATYVNQVSPLCVRVNQSGQWIGTPLERGITGNVGTATYSKQCPTNSAISGFRGRFSQYVDQLDFECRTLTAAGKLTGTGAFLGAVGPATGTAQGPYRCDSGNPGFAVYGRSGSWIDNFGVQCRQASSTFINTPPLVTNPGNQSNSTGLAVDLAITASDPDGNALTFSAIGLPPGLSVNAVTGHVTGTPNTAGNYTVALSAFDGTATTSVNFSWLITASLPFSLDPLPTATPKVAGTVVTYTATSRNGVGVQYSWLFDDGTPATAFSSSPTITHTFARPGIYYVTVTATSTGSPSQSQTVTQAIHQPLTANRPTMSTNILYEATNGGRVWVVNQDNNTVSVFNAVTNAKLAEIAVGAGPRTIAIAPNGLVCVVNKQAGTISAINPTTFTISTTITLPAGSQPFGLAFAPTGGFAFVTLEGTGALMKLNATNGAVVSTVSVGKNPRHVSVNADGTSVYVSRFVTPPLPGENTAVVQPGANGGEVVVVSAANMTVTKTITLGYSDMPDFEIQGSGVPNYLGAVAVSPDGLQAWVPSKQDNVLRGTLRNGLNLNFQNTVRAIASRIDLTTGLETLAKRVDLDNSSVGSAAAFDTYGNYLFVALETSREVAVVDAQGGYEIFRFIVGRAPQGLAVSSDGTRLYVNNFMDRTVGVFDLSRLVNLGESNVPAVTTLASVATEALTAQVLKGKQFFYDARDPRLARDAYMSCASCHNDGGQDGRVWDLTGMGEGVRNTVNLRGRASAQGFLHWTGNFDEVQDFEGQIRALAGGTGLMTDAAFNTGTRNQPLGDPKAGISTDLDALAAYVASLNTFANSPLRNANGTLTTAATAGATVFRDANCAQCHGGTAFTISAAANLRDVGTIKPASGKRLGGTLAGFDVPTLRDVWATAPYLHDGSAPTISAAITAHSGVALSATDLGNLVAYVEQIGAQEVSAPTPPVVNAPPVITNPGNQSTRQGTAVNLAIVASDPEGQALTYSATGLPTGLTIAATTGRITGTPGAAGSFNAAVTVRDALTSVTANFTWSITSNPPPVITNPGSQSGTRGTAVTLAIVASDPEGEALTYSATGLPTGLAISATTGAISGTPSAVGNFNVVVTVRDALSPVTASFTWSIVGNPPVITNPGNQNGRQGTAASLAIQASDPDGETLTYSATGLPTGLTIASASGAITGTPSAAGNFSVIVTVRDALTNATASFTWSIAANPPPVVANPGSQSGTQGTAVTLAIVASDPDGETLTYSATGLPTGLAISPTTGAISGTPSGAGTSSVTVTVRDAFTPVTASFTWTIAGNPPPVITNPGAQSSTRGTAVTLPISASDPDGETLTYSATGLPTGLAINSTTGSITGTPSAVGDFNVTVTVRDALTPITASFSWSIVGNPPVITNPGNQTGRQGTAASLAIQASDPDGEALTYSATGLPTGLTIASTTGAITGTPSAAGTFNVIVTVRDALTNATASFTWSISANPPPVVANPGSQSGTRGTAVTLAIVASDPEGETLTYSATGLPTGLAISPTTGAITGTPSAVGTFNVTVTVRDALTPVTTNFTWSIVGNPPTITNPGNQSGRQGTAVNLAIVASDLDGDALTYTATGLPTGLTIASTTGRITGTPSAAGSFSVAVTARDATVGATANFTWSIAANPAPAITNPGNQSGTQGTAVNLAIVASDPDGEALTYSATGLPTGLTIASTTGRITGTPSAAGNFNATVTVRDAYTSVTASFTWSLASNVDTTVPSTPTLTVTLSGGRPSLSWTASTDNVGVVGYIVYRSTDGGVGVEGARTSALGGIDIWAVSNVRYTYNVRAYDAAGNLSARSALVSITMP